MSYYDKTSTKQSDSITAGNNTGGLTVTLDQVGGRPFVNAYYNVSGDATITVEARYDFDDGTQSSWIEIDSLNTADADTPAEDTSQYPWQAFDDMRITTATTGIDVEFILAAGR